MGEKEKMIETGSSREVAVAVDPCWFLSANGVKSVSEDIRNERQNRESSGYPEAMPIVDAVRVFNIEQNCSKGSGGLGPLSVDEVIAAVRTPPDYVIDPVVWTKQRQILQKALLKGALPKGSLLVGERNEAIINERGESGDQVAEGIRIYLFLSLDQISRFNSPPADQIILIRKVFTGITSRSNR